MKFRYFLLIFWFMVVAGCANIHITSKDSHREEPVSNIRMNDLNQASEQIICLDKGERIPLKMSMDSDVFELSQGDVHIVLKQKVYLKLQIPELPDGSKMTEKEKQAFLTNIRIYLSPDAQNWESYKDLKALENLFGIKGGSFSLGMGVTRQEGVNVYLNLRTTSI